MTWESYPAWIWFAVESHLAIICASAPALKIFFKHALASSTFVNSFRSKDTDPNSNNSGQSKDTGTTVGKFQKTRPRKMGLHDLTIDSQDSTILTQRPMDTRDKAFTMFSSEEQLSEAYDDIIMEPMDRRVADEEIGRRFQGTFFADTDSDSL
jgi:hypothetical protein